MLVRVNRHRLDKCKKDRQEYKFTIHELASKINKNRWNNVAN